MAAHKRRLRPSNAFRWIACPASPDEEDGLPDEPKIWAAEGTAFHHIAALVLEFGLEPEDFIGHEVEADGFTFTFTKEWADYMQPGIDRLRELAPGGQMFVEQTVDLSPWLGPNESGQTDCGIVHVARREITIHDWKFGAGIAVQPFQNPQPMLYGLGFWHTIAAALFDNDPSDITVRIIIEQPRAPGGGGEWVTTMDDLLAFGQAVVEAAERTTDILPAHVPGEKQCRLCKAATALTCTAYQKWSLEIVSAKFEDLDDIDTPPALDSDRLTPERLAYLIKHRAAFSKFLDNCYAKGLHDTLSGESLPRMKAVLGDEGDRKWIDEDSAEAALVVELGFRDAFTRKLVSPAQAEKLLGKRAARVLAKHWARAPGKPILVPDDDDRPALQAYVERFEDLDAQDNDLI